MRTERRWLWVGAVIAAMVLLLAACGGNGNGNGAADDAPGDTDTTEDRGEADLHVVATEYAFDPDTLTAPADTEVTAHLDNQGTIEHDFTLDDAGLTVYADAQQSAEGSFTLSAGTYEFHCSIPGHREAGMEGTLTVE